MTSTYLLMLYITREQEDAIRSLFSQNHWTILQPDKELLYPATKHVFKFNSFDDRKPTVTIEDQSRSLAVENSRKYNGTFNRHRDERMGQLYLSFADAVDSKANIKECSIHLERLPDKLDLQTTVSTKQFLKRIKSEKVTVSKDSLKLQPLLKARASRNGRGGKIAINAISTKLKEECAKTGKSTKLKEGSLKGVKSTKLKEKSVKTVKSGKLKLRTKVIARNKKIKIEIPEEKGEEEDVDKEEDMKVFVEPDSDDEVDDVVADDDYVPEKGENESDGDDNEKIEQQPAKTDEEYKPYVYKYKHKSRKKDPEMIAKEKAERKERAKERRRERIKEQIKDGGKGAFPCDTCKKTYTYKRKYLAHLVDGKCSRQCHYCGKVFKKSQIKGHIFYRHEKNDVRFNCDICGRRFYDAYSLRSHKKNHDGPKSFMCDLCGKSVTSLNGLYIHKRKHDQAAKNIKFPCPQCPKVFADKEYLKYHLTYTHSDTKAFMCDICGNSYKTEPTLKNHKRAMHLNQRRFQCDVCKKWYKYSHQVSTHKKLFHERLTRFQCQICQKRFYFEGKLKDHMNVHNGLRPHQCPYCDYKSSTGEQMTQHKKKHRDSVPQRIDSGMDGVGREPEDVGREPQDINTVPDIPLTQPSTSYLLEGSTDIEQTQAINMILVPNQPTLFFLNQ